MTSLWLLGLCLGLGAVLGRVGRVPEATAPALTWWVVNVALPAMTLALVPALTADASLWFLVAPQWLGLVGAALLFGALGPRLGWSRPRTGAVILMAGLANTSFVGYPLLEALRGPGALPLGVVADQVGAFVALSTGGLLITAAYAPGVARGGAGAIVRKLVTFPPLWALVVGLGVGAVGGLPSALHAALLRIGSTLSPLALFAVGLRLRPRVTRDQALPLTLALAWKLALWPAVAWGLGAAAGVGGAVLTVGVLQAAMAPMITASILAEREQLDPPLARAILAIGIGLSLATVAGFDRML
ncbi:MAG: AEC family transporter [Kofleriaceae bacterium]